MHALSKRLAPLAAAAAVALPGFVRADPPDAQWSVREVVVTAPRSGPVLWRVQKGESEVWIVGALPVMPRALAWDSRRLERIITGANVVLIRPRATLDPLSALGMLMHIGLPHGQTLASTVPPDLDARLATASGLARKTPARYNRMRPLWAGLVLLADYQGAAGVNSREPDETLVRLARRHGVQTRPIASYNAKPVLANLEHIPDAQAQACLSDSIRDVEFLHAHAETAAKAWARGDLHTVLANYADPAIELCLEQSSAYDALAERSIRDTVAAVDAALARPGKSVAVFYLGALLRKDGALERLRAQGLEVSAPAA